MSNTLSVQFWARRSSSEFSHGPRKALRVARDVILTLQYDYVNKSCCGSDYGNGLVCLRSLKRKQSISQ